MTYSNESILKKLKERKENKKIGMEREKLKNEINILAIYLRNKNASLFSVQELFRLFRVEYTAGYREWLFGLRKRIDGLS